ncbi:MAG: menaquinone biosynthesis protein [Armatimonadetes bacterium]|nr:menaquinone biosynthesis protein [Armatimonadota bacterium]
MPLNLGVVPYLNALPLHWSLRAQNDIEIVADFPANLGARLQNGEFDAALLPVADHLRGVGGGILGDAIVGATREVRSVLLFSKPEIERTESVALDASSHSSVALIRILLSDFYRLQPNFLNHPPDLGAMLRRADAALLIGDPALEAAQCCTSLHVYDLAALWHHFTGLSFVFAAWTAKSGLENRGALEKRLDQARDEGETQISEIVTANPLGTSLSDAVVEGYLRNSIEYRLTPAHRAGMDEFARHLVRLEK